MSILIEKNGQWIEKHRFEKVDQDIRFIAEDKKGDLWLVNSKGGVIRVSFRPDINHPFVAGYDTSHGLPDGGVDSIGVATGHVIFATKNGIFRFNEEEKKFVPDETLGKEFAGGHPDSKMVFRLVEDKNRNIWFTSESRNYHAVPGSEGTFTIDAKPFRRIPTINQVNVIYPDPDGKFIWLGGSGGLFRYDKTLKKNYSQDFQTLIRRVILNENQKNERLLFGGCESQIAEGGKTTYPITIIEYKDRNLYFEFAAPFFEDENETLYQYFLEGFDEGWSNWNKEANRNYSNIFPGLYTFRVRAKNIYQYIGDEDVFQFKILPPWYLTWWFLVILNLLLLVLMLLVVKWRSGRLELQKQRLEQIINARTKDIKDKNQEMEKKTLQLKD